MSTYLKIAAEAGVCQDSDGNNDEAYMKIDGLDLREGFEEEKAKAFVLKLLPVGLGIKPEHLTFISAEEYQENTEEDLDEYDGSCEEDFEE